MTLQDLKRQIEDKIPCRDFCIFKWSGNDFTAKQYYREIAYYSNLPIEQVDDLNVLLAQLDDIFSAPDYDSSLKIFTTDTFDFPISGLERINNLIIVCKEVEKDTSLLYNNNVVQFPKLEDWQIKDYVYSIADGVDTKYLDWLIAVCNNDIYRLQKELDKLKIFTPDERKNLFEAFIHDGVFSDLSQATIFNLTNALIQKNIQEVFNIYKDLDKIDTNEMGFLAILYNGFKNVINVQLQQNPTAESCGLKPNQFYAIKHNVGFYNKDQLLNIFGLLTDVDRRIKIGELPMNNLIDYLIVNILS